MVRFVPQEQVEQRSSVTVVDAALWEALNMKNSVDRKYMGT